MKAALLCVVLGLLSLQAEGLSFAVPKRHLPTVEPPPMQGKRCPMLKCVSNCENGYQKGPDGCRTCTCNEASGGVPVKCKPVRCRKFCKHGWAKDTNGCEICRCAKTGNMVTPGPTLNKTSSVICSQPKVTGRCRAMLRSWYYNAATQTCEKFIYGGCGGNDNRFRTEEECQKACQKDGVTDHKKDECLKGKKLTKCIADACQSAKCPAYPNAICTVNHCGGCKAQFIVQSYDSKKGITDKNVTAQCYTNTTATIPEKWTVPEECKLPKAVGMCMALIPAWFYNVEAGECQSFSYGGCGGNKNNFKSKSECEKKCENGNIYQYATTRMPYPHYYDKYSDNYKPNKQEKDGKFESVKRLANLAEEHGIIPADAPKDMTRDHHPSYPDNMKVCLCY